MTEHTLTEHAAVRLAELAERWRGAPASERANFPAYITELVDALDVDRPGPARSGYQFEYAVTVVTQQGLETTNFIDLYKRDHFILEAKDHEEGRSNEILLRKAFGQVANYAVNLPEGPPPFLMVMDVGAKLLVWQRHAGRYGGFNAARTVDLRRLADRPDDVEFLRAIWLDPESLIGDARAARVTREVAERLARLAASLEHRGHDHELVARFLIRCIFTMFAEDEGLLTGQPFTTAIREIGLHDPEAFTGALGELWSAMDEGRYFGPRKLLRFNGHFFKSHETLPLTREDIVVLDEAAQADWREVEPTIFGTLLTRALDPEERHRLGAEYTPRDYVERLVQPTVEEPIRDRWTLVEAEILQIVEDRERRRANKAEWTKLTRRAGRKLLEFHEWLRSLRFLDPACGSGNFLYVTLAVVKRIEAEVLRTYADVTGEAELILDEVGPEQFLGIEIKPWAREIAELTLWIGYYQAWREYHGGRTPPEPVLQDTGALECRDAVLAWDEVREDPERARPDPTPRIPHPVTGKLVPDPEARLPYLEHRGARQAEWPRADFIVGNPPYMGNKRMREAFGDGYVDALRDAYPEVPESADFVMYWWYRAAQEIAEGRTIRAGLITTNSITQTFNRGVVANAMEKGAGVVWAIPTHPWVDEAGSAAVRVAMTVIEREPKRAVRIEVNDEAEIVREVESERLNADLTTHADVVKAAGTPLLSNTAMSARGFTLVGRGFVLDAKEACQLLEADATHGQVIRPYMNGRDLTSRPRGVFVIDFALLSEEEAKKYPLLFNIVRDRVKPQRDANKMASRKRFWWRFGAAGQNLRDATAGLNRMIATPYVSRFRFFTFLDTAVAPDEKLVCVALSDAYSLGVLSSRLHADWAQAAGSRLGVGNDLTYNNTLCFDPFPFPDPPLELRERIAEVAERLDRHRKEALERDEQVTMTGMYNVVEKLRSGEALTPRERKVHELAACGILRDLHDELDALVAEAYGWPWPLPTEEILARLVALHDERVAEEAAGKVRWLRPEYQRPRFGEDVVEQAEAALETPRATARRKTGRPEWPASAVEQMAALQERLAEAPLTVDEAVAAFRGARRELVERHLETLEIMGEVRRAEEGRYHWIGG